jgi:hypothetical protein
MQDARAPREFPPNIQLQGLFAPESTLNQRWALPGLISGHTTNIIPKELQ